MEATKYAIESRYYWPGMHAMVKAIIKKCEECNKNNRKDDGGEEFVVTTHPLEKTAVDIVKFGEKECYALVWIDYFTQVMKVRKLANRTSQEIIERNIYRGGNTRRDKLR